MVRAVKHEWHSHDRQYYLDIDEDILSEIYPDLDEDEIAEKLAQLENGDIDVEEIVSDAYEEGVDLDWDFGYDDCWTDRKGGYDVTYEIDNDYEGEQPPEEPVHTHKCSKCKWTGMSYNTSTVYLREDGSVIEDYWSSEEESHGTKDVCPMCDSDTELTEAGLKEKQERDERMARWAKEDEENEEDTELDQMDMAQALEELKLEFEQLMSHTIRCTECDWTGKEEQCEKEGICPNCAAHTEEIE